MATGNAPEFLHLERAGSADSGHVPGEGSRGQPGAQRLRDAVINASASGANAIIAPVANRKINWYVEVSKSKLQEAATKANCLALQDLVLRQTLLLLHPFIPFITEELWSLLGYGAPGRFIDDAHLDNASQLATAQSLHAVRIDPHQVAIVERLKSYASQARALKAEHGLANRRDLGLANLSSPEDAAIITANRDKLVRVIGAREIKFVTAPPEGAPAAVTALGTLYLVDLSAAMDVGAEKQRLAKELEKLLQHIASTEARLANPAFTGKAPPAVIAGARQQLAGLQSKRAELERLLAALTRS